MFKRATRWIRKATRTIKRTPYGNIYLPISTRSKNLYLENNQSYELVADVFQTPTAPATKGHASLTYALGDILQTQDLFEIVKYYYWAILSCNITFRVIGFRNLYKFVEPEGGAGKVYFYHNPGSTNTSLELYVASFNNALQLAGCTGLAENTLVNRNKLQECGAYRRLFSNGKPVTFKWNLPLGSRGQYSGIPSPPVSTQGISDAFQSAAANAPVPYGVDFLWYDCDHYLGSGTGKKATIIISATFHTVLHLYARKPDYT